MSTRARVRESAPSVSARAGEFWGSLWSPGRSPGLRGGGRGFGEKVVQGEGPAGVGPRRGLSPPMSPRLSGELNREKDASAAHPMDLTKVGLPLTHTE